MEIPTHAGGVVVRRNGENWDVLLLKRDLAQSQDFFPNGSINEKESDLSCAKREVLEEGGLTVDLPKADLGLVVRGGIRNNKERYIKSIRYYLFISDDVRTSQWEVTTPKNTVFFARWIPVSETNPEQFLGKEKELIPTALRFLK